MLEGIKLLIERMDSNPEGFVGDLSYRWAAIMQDLAKHGPEFLEEEDVLALNRKVKEVRRKELNAKIVDEIHTAKRLKKAQEEFEMKERMVSATQSPIRGALGGATMSTYWLDEAIIQENIRKEKRREDNLKLAQSQAYKKRSNQSWP